MKATRQNKNLHIRTAECHQLHSMTNFNMANNSHTNTEGIFSSHETTRAVDSFQHNISGQSRTPASRQMIREQRTRKCTFYGCFSKRSCYNLHSLHSIT